MTRQFNLPAVPVGAEVSVFQQTASDVGIFCGVEEIEPTHII